MKRLTTLLCLILCMAMLVGCGASQPAAQAPAEEAPAEEAPAEAPAVEEKKIELVYAGIKTDEDPASIAMNVFKEEVEKNSDSITVKVYTNGALGQLNDLLSGMTDGTIDMMHNTLTCYPWVAGAEAFNVVAAPFLFSDNAELEAFLATEEVQGWFETIAEDSGVRCIMAAGELMPRQLTANKPIESAADFKGLKIRTAESAIVQATMQKLGATPIVVAFADLYMALRQGTVDAQEMPFMNTVNASLYEVQDYYMQTDYIRDVSAIFMSNETWNSMSEEQQAVVLAAADKAVHAEEEATKALLEDVYATLEANMTKVDIDVASIQEALGADFYDQFEGDLWPEGTMEVVKAFKAEYAG